MPTKRARRKPRAASRPRKPAHAAAKRHHPRFRPGAHAFWSGTISFGLVSIPVQLFPTSRSAGDSLRMLARDGTPLQRRYFNPDTGRDIHPEHIVRGYELEDGSYVVVRDEELESLEPKKSQVIELQQFVPREQLSPAYFERAYVLTPRGDSTKAYHLLAQAMEDTDRVGIATFVMRDKEYLIAILSEGGVLRAETLRFHDELRSPEEIGLPDKPRLDRSLVAKFEQAIQKNSAAKLAPSDLQDQRSAQLRELAEKKRKQGIDLIEIQDSADGASADAGDDEDEPDELSLLEAIRQSLQGK